MAKLLVLLALSVFFVAIFATGLDSDDVKQLVDCFVTRGPCGGRRRAAITCRMCTGEGHIVACRRGRRTGSSCRCILCWSSGPSGHWNCVELFKQWVQGELSICVVWSCAWTHELLISFQSSLAALDVLELLSLVLEKRCTARWSWNIGSSSKVRKFPFTKRFSYGWRNMRTSIRVAAFIYLHMWGSHAS